MLLNSVGKRCGISLAFALLLSGLVGEKAIGQNAQKTQTNFISSSSSEIRLYVTVTDKDRKYVAGLDYYDFAIHSDKQPQSLSYFSKKDDPAGIVLVVDTSGSMRGQRSPLNRIQLLQPAVSQFLQNSNTGNQYSIISFSTDVKLTMGWTSNSDEVTKSLGELAATLPKGQTAFYDACLIAIEQAKGSPYQKRVLIVFSDGRDSVSGATVGKLKRSLLENNILFYFLDANELLRVPRDQLDQQAFEARNFITDLTLETGALAFYPNSQESLNQSFDLIAEEFRHQYLLGFMPVFDRSGREFHKIKVSLAPTSKAQVERKRVLIAHQSGYFVAEKQKQEDTHKK